MLVLIAGLFAVDPFASPVKAGSLLLKFIEADEAREAAREALSRKKAAEGSVESD